MSQCTCLTSETAAEYVSDYIELAFTTSNFERSLYFSSYDFHTEVLF